MCIIIIIIIIIISAHVKCENKRDTGNYRGEYEHLKITQTKPQPTYWETTQLRNHKKTAILVTARKLRKVLMS